MDSADGSQSWWRNTRSSKLFILTVVNLAVFTDAYMYALIIPVLPFALHERVQIREDEVQQWIGILLAAYGAGLLIGSPIAGWFADRGNSRRGPYLFGLIALAASTVAFSLGHSKSVLFLGRLVQGASSASVHTVGMAILADTAGQAGAGAAMGFIGMSIALGVLIGPVIGGVLYHKYGYLAVFISGYALVALDFLLRIIMLLPSPKKSNANPDATYGTFPPVQIAAQNPLGSNQLLLPNPPSNPTDPLLPPPPEPTPTPRPHHHRHPILTLLSTPRMLAAILADLTQSIVLTGLETILPLRIKTLFTYNSFQVSLIFLILTIPSFTAPLIGHLSDRIGSKALISSGLLALTPLLILLRFITHYSTMQVILLSALLFLIGVALNMLATPAFTEAMYVVDDLVAEDVLGGPNNNNNNNNNNKGEGAPYAQAFGLMTIAYAAGSLVGPFVGGMVAEKVGWEEVTLAGGIMCGLCAGPCLYFTGGKKVRGMVRVVEEEEEGGGVGG